MHDPRHRVSPKLLNFPNRKRERERERKEAKCVFYENRYRMPISTTASHNFVRNIGSSSNFQTSPTLCDQLCPSCSRISTSSSSSSSSSVAPPLRGRHVFRKEKKVSTENESLENNSQTSNKNFRTVSSTVRQFYYRHAFASLFSSLLLHIGAIVSPPTV